MASVKAILRKDKTNEKNEHPIVIQIIHKRKKKNISLFKYITKKEWNSSEGFAIEKSKNKLHKLHLQKINILISQKINEIKNVIIDFDTKGGNYSIIDIINKVNNNTITHNTLILKYFDTLIRRLETIGKTGNAAVYKDARASFEKFRDEKDLTFDELTYKTLIDFESYLLSKGKKINTISIYMRTLRAVYNKAINEDLASKDLYPFTKYKIKHEKTSKRAIVKANISDIKNLDLSKQPDLQKARDYFMFSFYCRGMSFVDMAHLKVSNISDGRIYYARNKTNQKFTIKITPQIQEIIDKYSDLKIKDSYIFPIIIDPEGDIYTQYRNAMRLTNKKLKKIGEILELNIPLTTYVSRHSWATIAKREGISTAIISEGLGHESEKTTQIYLDSFENDVLDDANNIITSL
jgi:site-specific recombinase XerD